MTWSLIVEGHGEVEAAPVLLRRIVGEIDPQLQLEVPSPIRIPKTRLLRPGELERAVDLAARKLDRPGAVLILIDADDDCPAEHGPALFDRARRSRPDQAVGLVLAKREFESWFLAGAESLRGKRGLDRVLAAPSEPEEIRGAKEWLGRHMETGRKYRVTIDQPKLAAGLDLAVAAKRAPSLKRLQRVVEDLLRRTSGEEQG